MAASTKIFLLPKSLPITINPASSLRFFSSSSSSSTTPDSNTNTSPEPPPPPPPPSQSQSQSPSPHSSFLSSIKATLRQSEQQRNSQSPPPLRKPSSYPNQHTSPSSPQSIEEIKKNLHAFRSRTAPPPPPPSYALGSTSPSHQQISFEKLYQRNISPTVDSFDTIKKTLSNITRNPTVNQNDKSDGLNEYISRPNIGRSLKWGTAPNPSPSLIGGTNIHFPSSPVFAAELRAKDDGDSSDESTRTDFVKNYNFTDLGEKLRLLRPQKKGDKKDWFSLEELNERLVKLRAMEKSEIKSRGTASMPFDLLKDGVRKLQTKKNEEGQKKIRKFRAILLKYELIL